MRLIGESTDHRDVHCRAAGAQQAAGRGDPQVELEGVRRQSQLRAEAPDELEAAQPRDTAQFFEVDGLVPALPQERGRPPDGGVLGAIAAAYAWERVQMRPQT